MTLSYTCTLIFTHIAASNSTIDDVTN